MSVCKRIDCEVELNVTKGGAGYCRRHYALFKRNGVPYRMNELIGPDRPCSVPDCGREVRARGMCNLHYSRDRRANPPSPPPQSDLDQAFERLREFARSIGIPGTESWWVESPAQFGSHARGAGERAKFRLHMTHPTYRDEAGEPKQFVTNLARSNRDSVSALHLAEMFLLMNPAWTDFAETFDPARVRAARAQEERDMSGPYMTTSELMEMAS